MRVAELIDALGGPTVVGRRIGVRSQAVSNWKIRDAIPGQHHIVVWGLAVEKGVAWEPPGIPAPAAKSEAA